MRPIRPVAAEARELFPLVRAVLEGAGPALLPHPAGAAPEGLPAEVDDRVAVVVETSGSTGRPKRVALSAEALRASAAATEEVLGGAGRWLLCLPVHYIAGLQVLVRSALGGREPVILPPGPFTAEAFVAGAVQMPADDRRYVSLVPVQLARLVEAAEHDAAVRTALTGFDRILLGGQAAPERLLERAAALGARVTTTYGASETAGGCVYDGRPLPGVRAAVVDGELRLSGLVLAEGYLADPERTAERFVCSDGARWYRTNDGGRIEAEVVTVTGRLDDVIISGGVKVSLAEVEQAVHDRYPELGDAVAVAVDDEQWGQSSVVVADARFCGRRPDLFHVREAVTARLGKAAAPARILYLEHDLPRLESGKPDRQAIAALV